MIKAGQIDKGTALLIKGQPFICIEREFVNPSLRDYEEPG